MTPEQLRVVDRITEYLSGGGLFNPECANHDAVRDLLIDARDAHAAALEELARLNAAWKAQQFHLEHEEKESEFQELRAERAESALAECRAKLEVDPRTKYDGIDCRDETIRMLEAALAESERKCERMKFHAEAMAELLWYGPSDFAAEKKALDAYRAEFKEE